MTSNIPLTHAPSGPATAATSSFTFYDIESLANVFSVVAYTFHNKTYADVEIFYLVDDPALRASIDTRTLESHVLCSNPGLPVSDLSFHDLSTAQANLRLAQVIGLSDAYTVGDPTSASSYPRSLRLVCDTDPGYDPKHHPFIAGYNSQNYDTTMLALYFQHTFGDMHFASAQNQSFQHVIQHSADQQAALDAVAEASGDPRLRKLAPTPPTAAQMREHNDQLFTEEYIQYMPRYLAWGSPAAKIRKNMIDSGRHLDVARLNELQFKVSLKRLLGMLGRQIMESENLSHDTTITSLGQLYELLAYNVSDCLGLSQLFEHEIYSGNFDLKAGLMHTYTETRFARDGVSVRADRLAIDASSAKFVGRILAPYEPLGDIQGVSYMYPHPEEAKKQGIEPMDVLDHCFKFFRDEVLTGFVDPATNLMVAEPAAGTTAYSQWATAKEAWEAFGEVIKFYRSIRGENFNDDLGFVQSPLGMVAKRPNNLPYFRAGGVATSCFATFSTGGIHGAEQFDQLLRLDGFEYEASVLALEKAKVLIPDARAFVAEAKRQHNALPLPDGTYVDKMLVLSGSDPEKVKYRKPKNGDELQNEQLARAQEQVPGAADLLARQRPKEQALNVALPGGLTINGKMVLKNTTAANAAYRDEPAKKKPELFKPKEDGATKLNSRYTYTSAGHVVHEDFTSYYPNLLRNMRAFYNPELGEDRYANIFFEKEEYGAMLKDPDLGDEERNRIKTLREGTKLILNSASGAGDAGHKTPIKMNNQIISMRIMGQLFSWLIGQAQTLYGAKIISTNTDGLYSLLDPDNGFTQEVNDRVLAEQEKQIHIDIEPEPQFLISKDSNNRLELKPPRGVDPSEITVGEYQIVAAGGGTLACWEGPSPRKALAHPAVVDFALARYLQTIAVGGQQSFAEPFDPSIGRAVLSEAVNHQNPVKTLMMFQNVIAASRGSITYPFALDPAVTSEDSPSGEDSEIAARNPRALQMVNRVFVVRPYTVPGACNLMTAGAWKVPPASRALRRNEGLKLRETDKVALGILRAHGWTTSDLKATTDDLNLLPIDQDIAVRKISGIDTNRQLVVQNGDLHELPAQELAALIDALDLEVYLSMLEDTYETSWRNN